MPAENIPFYQSTVIGDFLSYYVPY